MKTYQCKFSPAPGATLLQEEEEESTLSELPEHHVQPPPHTCSCKTHVTFLYGATLCIAVIFGFVTALGYRELRAQSVRIHDLSVTGKGNVGPKSGGEGEGLSRHRRSSGDSSGLAGWSMGELGEYCAGLKDKCTRGPPGPKGSKGDMGGLGPRGENGKLSLYTYEVIVLVFIVVIRFTLSFGNYAWSVIAYSKV